MSQEQIEWWKNLIDSRRQCDMWDYSQEISRETIEEILRECWWRVPSKQNQMQYEVVVLDWSDPELRNDIYEWAIAILDENDPFYEPVYCEGIGRNPQVLAPWLLLFKNNDRFTKNTVDDVTRHAEIGMMAMMVALDAKLRGIDSGFSRCFTGINPKVNKALGLDDRADNFVFFLGLGMSTPEWKESKPATMLNPYNGEIIRSGISGEPEESVRPRPEFKKIVKFL
jgi:nitroreductase